jgi:hypothetical protein
VSRFEVESILLRHLYTKNINSLFSRVIHGTTSAHSMQTSHAYGLKHDQLRLVNTGRSEFEDGLGSSFFVTGYSYHMSFHTGLADLSKQTKFQS